MRHVHGKANLSHKFCIHGMKRSYLNRAAMRKSVVKVVSNLFVVEEMKLADNIWQWQPLSS